MEEYVQGTVASGFEQVRTVFAENFASRGEQGAALCVERGGERIVDLWGGEAEPGQPFTGETPAVLFSGTKGLVASCMLLLVERGELQLDRPVQRYWPELRPRMTVRQLLNHRSGLVALDRLPMELLSQPEALSELLAMQEPMWRPGSAQGYGSVAGGLYNAELLRQMTGTTVGRFFASEVVGPLGLDLYIGLPKHVTPAPLVLVGRSQILRKVLPTAMGGRGVDGRVFRAALQPGSPTARSVAQPPELGARGLHNFNRRELLELELPWAGGVGTARALAGLYGHLSCGSGPWSQRVLRPLHHRQSWARRDRVLLKPMGWSQAFIKEELRLFSPNRESFGHPGAGGSFGFADPTLDMSMAFVTRTMDWRLRPHRPQLLCQSIYRCLRR